MSTQYYPAWRQNCAASCMQIMSNIGATKLTKIFSKKKNVFPNVSSVITQGDFAPFFCQDKYYEIHQCIQHIICD